jgi:signal peptidase I
MPDVAPILLPSPDIDSPNQAKPSNTVKRRVLAALASAILPGAGQLLVAAWGKAFLLLASFAMLLVCFWPLRVLRFYAGFLSLYAAWVALYIYATCSALLGPTRSGRPSRWWLTFTIPVAVVSLCLLGGVVTRAAGFRSFEIPSTSMENALRPGDKIVVDSRARAPKRQGIIVFSKDHVFLVKRVIAIEGDSIQGRGGIVLVNGGEQNEPYVRHTGGLLQTWMSNFGPIDIPKGHSFVMGDNRDVSLDSRSTDFGLVDNKWIIGTPLYVIDSGRVGKEIR